ncbi:MAG: anti-sigma factor [Elainellaceae cyanobacterium]
MTGSVSVDEQRELLAGYVLYDLSPDEAALVEQWIAIDPAIAEEIERLQQTLELTYAPKQTQPPDRLRASILNAYGSARQDDPTPEIGIPVVRSSHQPQPRVTRRRRLTASLGAVAAMLIVGLSISNYVLWRSLQTAIAQQQTPEFRRVSLMSTDAAAGSVTIELAPDDLKALLEADLPPLPEGKVYVLWTVLRPDAPFTADEKGAILTHVFAKNGQRTVEEAVALPPVYRDSRWIKAIAVTIEDGAAPQRHRSSPILIEML